MLISGASVTGIDLKGTRMVFLLEPFCNENELEQAKSRAIRYGLHTNLPKNEQNVTVYTLILDKPLPGFLAFRMKFPALTACLYEFFQG